MARRALETAWGSGLLRRAGVLLCAAAFACASVPATSSPSPPGSAWPEGWGIPFALRCSAEGEDIRVCICLAEEIQRKWTPEQFRAREPDGLAGEVARCRERASR